MEIELNHLGLSGYKVDTNGNIFSWKCKAGTKQKRWKHLKPWLVKGYLVIGLKVNGRRVCKYIHRLVLEAFVGPCPPGQEGCHNDSNPLNNTLANLRWDSPLNNCLDRKLNGVHSINTPRGSKHGCSKLVEKEVVVIRKLVELNILTQAKLARIFEITPTNICDIIKRNTWKEV